jgi:peptide/nickel transport system permease protein
MMNKTPNTASDSINPERASIENKELEGLSQRQIVFRRFVRHRAAMVAIIYLMSILMFVFSALDLKFGPFLYRGWWKFDTEDLLDLRFGDCPGGTQGCPTISLRPQFLGGEGIGLGKHPFGQDNIGRDYFALVMKGTQRSVIVMLVIGFFAAAIGTIVGAISGYFRGTVDSVLMRFTDFVITIPAIVVGAVIGARIGNLGAVALAVFLGLFAWTGLARLVRGEFFRLREMEFVDGARVAGASTRRIIFKHILPNAIGVIIVSVTLLLSGAILLETSLSYLGFGVVPPDVSLGLLISTYQDAFSTRPWLFWYPGFFIVSIALSINFIGDGLRDAFDPRQRRKISKKEKKQARIELQKN